jgi:prepilin-type N-terminal cleavage/methylation domain-containing protein
MPQIRYARGLTLLELLLVIAILAAMAFMTVASVTDGTTQIRRDNTVTRLNALRIASIGRSQPMPNGERGLSGFAVDNGVLPTIEQSLRALLERPDALADPGEANRFRQFAPQIPIFDPVPDAAGFNNGTGEVWLSTTGDDTGLPTDGVLLKGWRDGYLTHEPGPNDVWRDGWARIEPDDAADTPPKLDDMRHFGWQVSVADFNFTITSFGRDGISDEDTPTPDSNIFDIDLETAILSAHWRVDITNWQVTISNPTSAAVTLSAGSMPARDFACLPESGHW